jgi:hypothetical protein
MSRLYAEELLWNLPTGNHAVRGNIVSIKFIRIITFYLSDTDVFPFKPIALQYAYSTFLCKTTCEVLGGTLSDLLLADKATEEPPNEVHC